ncbi:pilus assembly protein [Altererythrobacter sp. ZODW24]|uniref:TadE/TadG family type IV pilus assembly protein n=1 Tax=Altererythrobacter sp. ZODW24 TaxID=2185142 RepID=UPI000DF81404|nr:pilus assembly protein [Altererythrobacter sp. ZODW24]
MIQKTPKQNLLKRLRASQSGLALTEFALSMPLMMTASMWGFETANQAIVQMEISQLAIHMADNASRIGDTSLLQNRKIYESDINDVFVGANIQAGSKIDFLGNGRAIISSLEVVDGTTDQQYIAWQRCAGELEHASSYGNQGDGYATGIDGLGKGTDKVYAFAGEAVMFVEVAYTYQPLISDLFTSVDELTAIAAFTVRADRDLSQVYQRDPSSPDPIASCSVTP